MKKIATLFIGLILFNCSSRDKPKETLTEKAPDYILDLKSIALKDLKGVEAVLGKSEFVEKIKDSKSGCTDCPKYSFKNGEIEIVFIDSKADWITINDMKGAKFENCSIDKLGDFNCINRDFKSDDVMRWNSITGFEEIALFRKLDNGKMTPYIDYAYIKVESK